MPSHSMSVRIIGESGEGIVSTGEILSRVLQHTGKNIITFRTYPAEIKGGQCLFQVRFSEEKLHTAGENVDLFVCFDKNSYEVSKESRDNSTILFNSDDTIGNGRNEIGIPLTTIARSELESLQSKNMVALGAVSFLLGLDVQDVLHVTGNWFAGKDTTLVHKNFEAIKSGYAFCQVQKLQPIKIITSNTNDETVILSGNQALVLGALSAECRYFAGYPITPASNILEHMVEELPKFGGIGIQTEDEMAALGACIGASYTGTKAMTATSGPGLSLMHELIGMASMMEIPVVIVDAQRAGPSTGMPTKMEQSDLLAAIHGSHGEAPRVVLAPGSVEETFSMTIQAFNISEALRLPVVLLTDITIAQRTATLPTSIFDHVELKSRPIQRERDETFKPYQLNGHPINAMALPGTVDLAHVITGLEHDESGTPSYTSDMHTAMMQKRFDKLDRVFEFYAGFEEFPAERRDIGLISWGSTIGPILELLDIEEERFAFLHLKILNPLPKQAIREFTAHVDQIVVIENNYQGQLAELIKAVINTPVKKLTKVDGLPFTRGELEERLKRLEIAEVAA